MINPHLNYGILVWCFSAQRIERLKKRAIRLIHNAKHYAHTNNLFKKSNILKLVDIFSLQIVKFYYNMFHSNLPNYFLGDHFIKIADKSKKKTRHNITFYHVYHRLESTTKTLRYQLISTINNLEPIILEKVRTHSFDGISNYYKIFLISNYPAICRIPNCYVCLRTH